MKPYFTRKDELSVANGCIQGPHQYCLLSSFERADFPHVLS